MQNVNRLCKLHGKSSTHEEKMENLQFSVTITIEKKNVTKTILKLFSKKKKELN
jgi:hypothetical protein